MEFTKNGFVNKMNGSKSRDSLSSMLRQWGETFIYNTSPIINNRKKITTNFLSQRKKSKSYNPRASVFNDLGMRTKNQLCLQIGPFKLDSNSIC